MSIVDTPVSALLFERQIDTILHLAKRRISRFVCVANVHMLMEAHWNQEFRAVFANADLVTSDGMPLVWLMRLLGHRQQDRVAGLGSVLKAKLEWSSRVVHLN